MILNAPEGFLLAKWRVHVCVLAASSVVSRRMTFFFSSAAMAAYSSAVVLQVESILRGILVSGSLRPCCSTFNSVDELGVQHGSISLVRWYGPICRSSSKFFIVASSRGVNTRARRASKGAGCVTAHNLVIVGGRGKGVDDIVPGPVGGLVGIAPSLSPSRLPSSVAAAAAATATSTTIPTAAARVLIVPLLLLVLAGAAS